VTIALRGAHILDSLELGGTEWQCVSLLRQLRRRSLDNVLLSFRGHGPLLSEVQAAGIPFVHVPYRGLRRPQGAAAIARLALLMRRRQIDLVQGYGFYSNVPGLLAGRLARVPALIAGRRDMGEFLRPWERLLERLIFTIADAVVVNAQAIRDQLVTTRQVAAHKIDVIPSGIDLERFDQLAARSPIAPWAAEGRSVVGMVAKFRTQKDHPTLLQAAQRVLRTHRDVLFVLVGDGFLRPAMERLAHDLGVPQSVRFVGDLQPEQIPAATKSFSICVLASRGNEGTPNAVLEGMAAARPIVATDTGGSREAVLDGETGFLVSPGDAAALAERIAMLLDDPAETRRMGKAGRLRVEQEFSLTRMTERFAALYAEVVSTRHRGR
jgi:glycosyltransferase involved in cell wall biosynthesis